MLEAALEFLAEAVGHLWPWEEKRLWKASLVLVGVIVAAVVIFVAMAG